MTNVSYKNGRRGGKSVCAAFLALGSFLFFGGIYLAPEHIKEFYAVYLVFLVLYCVLFKQMKICVNALDLAWIAYFGVGLLGILVGGLGASGGLLDFALSLALGLAVNAMVMNATDRSKQITAIWWLCGIVLLGCALQFVAQGLLLRITSITLGAQQYAWHLEFVQVMKRVVGFSYQTGVTAHYLCLFEILLLGLWITSTPKQKGRKLFCLVGFLAGFVLILLTEKRSSVLVVLILFAVLFFLAYRKYFLKYGVLFAAVLVLMVLATETGRELIARTLGSNPFSGRLNIYGILWEMIQDSPWVGNGIGSTLIKVTGYTNGHNIYIQTWAECGIIGLGLLVFILVVNLRRAIKMLMRALRAKAVTMVDIFCVGYQIYFIVIGMIANPLYDIYPLVMYMLTAGMVKSARKEPQQLQR